jgi:hypothetical protein
MKHLRILAVIVLALTATPLFAYQCGRCLPSGACTFEMGIEMFCEQNIDYCIDYPYPCFSGDSGTTEVTSLSAEMAIASVEIVTPDGIQVVEQDQPVRTARLETESTR